MGANVDELQEPLRSIVKKILEESGGKVTVKSARRSRQEQAALYQKYLSGKGNLAAKPGHSQHESGLAVDFGGDLGLAAKLAAKYGLNASVPGEPWHFTLGSGVEGEGQDQFGYDLGGETSPEDTLANRLHSVLRIIGQDATVGSPGTTFSSSGDPDIDTVFSPGSPELTPEMLSSEGGQVASGMKGELQQYARSKLAQYGFSEQDFPALVQLWNKESGWNPQAQNPTSTAYGIAQFLNGTWEGTGYSKTADPRQQIEAGLQYIKSRYGSPTKALQFHNRQNWY